jgi:hypothetical protein
VTLSVRAHPEAVEELDAAIAWYDQGGQGRGDRFAAAYDAAIDRCVMWPESGVEYQVDAPDVAVRTARVARSAYRVIYFVEDGVLWVVAVAHERRRPGYWRDRVEGGQR